MSLPPDPDSSEDPKPSSRWLQNPQVLWLFALSGVLALYFLRLFAFFSASPIFFISVHQGFVAGFLLLLTSGVILTWINPSDAVFLIFSIGSAALVAGYWFRQKKAIPPSIASGVACLTLLMGLAYVFIYPLEGAQKWTFVEQAQNQFQENLERAYQEMEKIADKDRSSPQTNEEKIQQKEFFHFWARALIPGGMISMTALSLWIFFIIFRRSFSSLGFQKAYENLTSWRSPEMLIWLVIATLGALILKAEVAKVLAANGLIVLCTVYLFQGIAIVMHWMKKRDLTPRWRFLCYLLAILLFQLVTPIFIGLGFMDVWVDLRKLKAGET